MEAVVKEGITSEARHIARKLEQLPIWFTETRDRFRY
jgi:hypothetical protein